MGGCEGTTAPPGDDRAGGSAIPRNRFPDASKHITVVSCSMAHVYKRTCFPDTHLCGRRFLVISVQTLVSVWASAVRAGRVGWLSITDFPRVAEAPGAGRVLGRSKSVRPSVFAAANPDAYNHGHLR